MMKRLYPLILILIGSSCSTLTPRTTSNCAHPWVFFDLGDTLIDTKGGAFHEVDYLPGASDLLKKFKAEGYRIGLISNIPEGWGDTHPERISRLKSELARDWNPKAKEPFHWEWIDRDAYFLPATVKERKPASTLFERAIHWARRDPGCENLNPDYYSENPVEIQTANRMGFHGILKPYP